MARRKEPREGKSFEQFRNWLVDIVTRLFMNRYKTYAPGKWNRLMLAIQQHETEARLSIIMFTSVLEKVVQWLPLDQIPLLNRVGEIVKDESTEVLEQLQDSFILYARGQHVVLEAGEAEVKESDVKGIFTDFIAWAEGAAGDMKDSVLRMVHFILPIFEDTQGHRDRHLMVVAGLDDDQWKAWAKRLAGLDDSDRGAVMRLLKHLGNPELLEKLVGLPDKQFMKVVRAYAGKGVIGTADDIAGNLATLLTDVSTQTSAWTVQKRTEFKTRRDQLKF